ncbi:MAG: FAD-dependent oxidoreductase [Planctomycetia bacterium]|nr:FAD-dependent oxidoreductase [Planctomycetia bacterium]
MSEVQMGHYRFSLYNMSLVVVLTAALSCTCRVCFSQSLFLEAEAFKELGGWVVDPHSMQQMGSSYIMAHGKGEPVADAWTRVDIPQEGEYFVWVRTRDWTAVWGRGTPAGQFNIAINDVPLPTILGTNGKEWAWQKAGLVRLPAGTSKISFKDLTGFNGRCDALYLTCDPNDIPANTAEKLVALRDSKTGNVIRDAEKQYDLIVVGGGMSGMCAALAAARTGCSVLLLQDREVLGGCNSSEIRVGLGGHIHLPPYTNLGNIVEEVAPIHGSGGTYDKEYYEDARKEIIFHKPGTHCDLRFREHVYAVEADPNDPKRIGAVISRNTHTGKQTRFRAPLFVDATGDAVIARMMNCEVMYGREARAQFNEINAPEIADRQVMGHSVLWIAKRQEEPVSFPDIDWALPFTDETAYFIRGGDWEQEAGQYRDMADETEYIRDYGLLSIYSNWSFLKNHSSRKAEFAYDGLDWVSPIGGKRESYRVVGDYILNQNDLENTIIYPDATASINWNIDLHFPDPINVDRFEEPFRSCAYHRLYPAPYPVPYRCLYAKDCKNLFLAGRHISTTHVAFAAARVMRSLGMLGEVVGMAASVCKQENILPRDIYETHFEQLKTLMQRGVPKSPLYHGGGTGDHESYHFKELGFLSIYPNPSPLSEELINRIKALGMIHRHEHPQLMEKKDRTKNIKVEMKTPLSSIELDKIEFFQIQGGALSCNESDIVLDQDIAIGIKGGTFDVGSDSQKESALYLSGLIESEPLNGNETYAPLRKTGTGKLIVQGIDTTECPWNIEQGTVIFQRSRSNEDSHCRQGNIIINPGAALVCDNRNVFGIVTEQCSTIAKNITVNGGTLIGPEYTHVNTGAVVLNDGTISSTGAGAGSDRLGNFCFAGKLTACGNSRIDAKRISFRYDISQWENGSGKIVVPEKNDLLTLTSSLHAFNDVTNATLEKFGQGSLLLAGTFLSPFHINLTEGSLELAGKAQIASLRVNGNLILSQPGQSVLGKSTFTDNGFVVVDLAALAKTQNGEPLLIGATSLPSEKIRFSFNPQGGKTFSLDLDKVRITQQPLSTEEKDAIIASVERLAVQGLKSTRENNILKINY